MDALKGDEALESAVRSDIKTLTSAATSAKDEIGQLKITTAAMGEEVKRNTENIIKEADKASAGIRQESDARIAQSKTMSEVIQKLAEDNKDRSADEALRSFYTTSEVLMTKLANYKKLAEDKDKNGEADFDDAEKAAIVDLLKEISDAGVADVTLGPEERQRTMWQTLSRKSKDNPMIKRLLESKELFHTDYMTQKKKLEVMTSAAGNIDLIKLGNYLLARTGRENGPDLGLVMQTLSLADTGGSISPEVKDLINDNTSITEVFNILAFLTNKPEERRCDPNISIEGGEHSDTGIYKTTSKGIVLKEGTDKLDTWSLSSGKVTEPLLSIDTMNPSRLFPGAGIYIPQGILKRRLDNSAKGPILLKKDEVPFLFIACINQMVKIMRNVRTTFSGWTKLSTATSGGGSKSKSKTKKNRHSKRRSNRRKY